MRKFIKNSFLTLLKFKAILILLFLFSFLASGLFLTYANSKKSYLDQYESISQKGSLPDINVYQNYDYSFLIKAEKADQHLNLTNHQTASQEQPIKWKFSFDRASDYVRYATSLNRKHYLINPLEGEAGGYFSPALPFFSWSASLVPSEVDNYIKTKSKLLLAELESDQSVKVAALVNQTMKKNFPNASLWYHHNVNSLSLKLNEKRYAVIQVDQFLGDDELNNLNKLVYYYGNNDQLFAKNQRASRQNSDLNLTFSRFSADFSQIKRGIINQSINRYPAEYLDLYQALFINFSYQKQLPKAQITLKKLIDYYHQTNTHHLIRQLDTSDLDTFFVKGVVSDSSAIGHRHQLVIKLPNFADAKPTIITNPCAYQTTISTANVFHGHYRYSQDAYEEWAKFLVNNQGIQYNQSAIENKLNELVKKYPRSFVFIGDQHQIPFLIVGAGISPNYIFPLMDSGFSRDFNNFERSIFMYTTPSGRDRIKSFYPLEAVSSDILYARFPSLNQGQIGQIVYTINQYAKKMMNLLGRDSAYFLKDPRDLNQIAAFRVLFLPALTDKLNSIIKYGCIVILVLTTSIAFFVTKNMVDQNRHIISIFNSNGFSLFKLVASFVLTLVIPTLLGCLAGFVAGIFSQRWMSTFLGQFWFTVKPKMSINWSDFLISTSAFNLGIILFLLVTGMFLTKRNLASSLKNDINYKSSRIELLFKKLFFFAPILTRFRVSIAFNAIYKMLILTSMIAVTVVTFGLSASTFGKFQLAKQELMNENHYAYAVDLQTPSLQSGPIKYVEINQLGRSASGFSGKGNHFASLAEWNNLQFASGTTFGDYHNDLFFLKDVVSSRLQVDQLIFSQENKAFNLWELLRGTLSANQLIESDHSYQQVMEYLFSCQREIKFISKNEQTKTYQLTALAYKQNESGYDCRLNDEYIKFLNQNLFQKRADLTKQQITNYLITYNNLGIDQRIIGKRHFYDQKKKRYQPPKYAYLKVNTFEGIDLFGIQNNDPNDVDYLGPKLYLVKGSPKQLANQILFNHPLSLTEPIYPVIINQALALKESLKVGSIWKVHPENLFNRKPKEKLPIILNPKPTTSPVNLKVIGISRSSKNPCAYLSYLNANKILKFKFNSDQTPYYFNGFYASENDQLDFSKKVLSLFSPSGLYPSVQSFDGNFKQILRRAILHRDQEQLKQLALALGIKPSEIKLTNVDQYTKTLAKLYTHPYVIMWKQIFKCQNDLRNFDIIAYATSTFLVFSALIAMFISFFIVILIFVISTNNLKNMGIRLQVFGYSSTKVLLSILAICLPALIIGLVISYPLMIYLGHVFSKYFVDLTGIALTLAPPIFGVVVGSGVVMVLLMISFSICYYLFARINLSKAIKGFWDV